MFEICANDMKYNCTHPEQFSVNCCEWRQQDINSGKCKFNFTGPELRGLSIVSHYNIIVALNPSPFDHDYSRFYSVLLVHKITFVKKYLE